MISEGTPTTPAGTGTLAAVLLENTRFAPTDAKAGELVVTTDTTGTLAKDVESPGPPPVRTTSPSIVGMGALAFALALTAVTVPLTRVVLGTPAPAVAVATTALTVTLTETVGMIAAPTDMALGARKKSRPPAMGAAASPSAAALTAMTVTFLMAVTTGGRALAVAVDLRATVTTDPDVTIPASFKTRSMEYPGRGEMSTSCMATPL